MSQAEDFIREQDALYRHYAISEVQYCVNQFTGENLSSDEAVSLVQSIRDEKCLGPIDYWNLPGYVGEE